MARGPQIFRKSDVTRAIKAARAAGEEHFRLEIENGKIIVILGKTETPPIAATTDPALEKGLADED